MFEWDEVNQVYIVLVAVVIDGISYQPGDTLPESQVLAGVFEFIATTEQTMVALTEQLQAETITVEEWQLAIAEQILIVHTILGAIAAGGHLSAAEQLFISDIIKAQLGFLDKFAAALLAGTFNLTGNRILERIKLYMRAALRTFFQIKRRASAALGNTEERRVLGVADHCRDSSRPGCIELASLGWQPINTLPPIGDATCLANCRCRFEFR